MHPVKRAVNANNVRCGRRARCRMGRPEKRRAPVDFPSPLLLQLVRLRPALLSFVHVGLRFPWHRLLR